MGDVSSIFKIIMTVNSRFAFRLAETFKSLLIRILYIYYLFLVEGIMGRQKLELLEDRDKTLKGEVFYTCFLKWRREQENGLAQICKLAELLRDVGYKKKSSI